LKNNRELDEDSITAELIKGGGRMLRKKIHVCTDAASVEERANAR
jgi:hypothetical protein